MADEKQWMVPNGGAGGFMPRTLEDLGLDPLAQARVLEWFAFKVWVAMNEGSGEREYVGKLYDPLSVELETTGSGVAHSYVFDFTDGGRHHPFHSLHELEEWLTDEAIAAVRVGYESKFDNIDEGGSST